MNPGLPLVNQGRNPNGAEIIAIFKPHLIGKVPIVSKARLAPLEILGQGRELWQWVAVGVVTMGGIPPIPPITR